MNKIGQAAVLGVILAASFYCFHQGWNGLGGVGIVCAALYFLYWVD